MYISLRLTLPLTIPFYLISYWNGPSLSEESSFKPSFQVRRGECSEVFKGSLLQKACRACTQHSR